MARTYRDIAVEDMLKTAEEAMSQVTDWWGDLPQPMQQAIEQFRAQLGGQLIPWNLLKEHSTEKYTKPTTAKTLPDEVCCGHEFAMGSPNVARLLLGLS